MRQIALIENAETMPSNGTDRGGEELPFETLQLCFGMGRFGREIAWIALGRANCSPAAPIASDRRYVKCAFDHPPGVACAFEHVRKLTQGDNVS
jgi:hypothetical protein